MKSQNLNGNAEATSKIVSLSGIAEEEKRRSALSAAEIRWRAFEICVKRVGIDCCDLHDWLQAERELWEQYKETAKEQERGGTHRRNDIFLSE